MRNTKQIHWIRRALLATFLVCLPILVLAAPPKGYYAPAAELTGEALKTVLHDVILDHEVIPYSSARYDVRDAIDELDEDPASEDDVRLIYSGFSMAKDAWPAYNREHVWPQSLGAEEGTPAHTDLHHIFACDANVNSARGNRRYDECEGNCNVHQDAPEAAATPTSWEPPDDQKGDVARALFYMDVRYEGDRVDEPNLRLVEWGVSAGCNCMGRLSTLLRWHEDDPVDARERARNESVYAIQGNRNPFIDHPELVERVWSHLEEEQRNVWPVWDPLLVQPWINEIHYENEGVDADEGFEIAGPAGTNLTGWVAALYNGRDGRIYAEVALEGIIDDEGAGFGAVWFAVPNLQNGGQDGIAIVRPNGQVVSFVSYEGQVRGNDGPAQNISSEDIGVFQDEESPADQSLQLVGRGGRYMDFGWQSADRSPGQLNGDQELFRSVPIRHRLPQADAENIPEDLPEEDLGAHPVVTSPYDYLRELPHGWWWQPLHHILAAAGL